MYLSFNVEAAQGLESGNLGFWRLDWTKCRSLISQQVARKGRPAAGTHGTLLRFGSLNFRTSPSGTPSDPPDASLPFVRPPSSLTLLVQRWAALRHLFSPTRGGFPHGMCVAQIGPAQLPRRRAQAFTSTLWLS